MRAQVLLIKRQRFIAAMDDDFNAPVALGVLQELTREVNTLLNSGEAIGRDVLEAIDGLYRELGGQVLGLIPEDLGVGGIDAERQEGLIQLLIELRAEARQNKNYALADRIRERLAALGIVLEARPDGTIYKIQ